MTDWRHDPERSHYDARHKPQPKGVLPHHLRCDWHLGEQRCVRADGHVGEHQAEKQKEDGA